MKFIVTYICVLGASFCCKSQENEHVSKTCINPALKVDWYLSRENELDTYSIILNEDSTYELYSFTLADHVQWFNVGYWHKDKDSVRLKTTPIEHVELVCTVKNNGISFDDNDSIVVIVLDKKGRPISNFLILPVYKGDHFFYKHNDFEGIGVIDGINNIVYDNKGQLMTTIMKTDSLGKLKIKSNDLKSVDLVSLAFICDKPIYINANRLSKEVVIILSIHQTVFFSGFPIRYDEYNLPDSYLITKNGLNNKYLSLPLK